jgi:hypothetical protein
MPSLKIRPTPHPNGTSQTLPAEAFQLASEGPQVAHQNPDGKVSRLHQSYHGRQSPSITFVTNFTGILNAHCAMLRRALEDSRLYKIAYSKVHLRRYTPGVSQQQQVIASYRSLTRIRNTFRKTS